MTPPWGSDGDRSIKARCFPVVELRQYTLHPGQRDMLIELFEREFIESQEALGISIIGQFRDLDDPERFVWLRGFQDMKARGSAFRLLWRAGMGSAPRRGERDHARL